MSDTTSYKRREPHLDQGRLVMLFILVAVVAAYLLVFLFHDKETPGAEASQPPSALICQEGSAGTVALPNGLRVEFVLTGAMLDRAGSCTVRAYDVQVTPPANWALAMLTRLPEAPNDTYCVACRTWSLTFVTPTGTTETDLAVRWIATPRHLWLSHDDIFDGATITVLGDTRALARNARGPENSEPVLDAPSDRRY